MAIFPNAVGLSRDSLPDININGRKYKEGNQNLWHIHQNFKHFSLW
jgi:hypothetical protein